MAERRSRLSGGGRVQHNRTSSLFAPLRIHTVAPEPSALWRAGLRTETMNIKILDPKGEVAEKAGPIGNEEPARRSTWLSRNKLNEVLHAQVAAAHADAVKVLCSLLVPAAEVFHVF